uniref:Uncharacterized protein n=1 Tax=Rhizophagus irregularis (strain DAOM 181602 / DAOM 197198 / MUCL 43194) TaxID=747089 RepID=U9T270_RHIID
MVQQSYHSYDYNFAKILAKIILAKILAKIIVKICKKTIQFLATILNILL